MKSIAEKYSCIQTELTLLKSLGASFSWNELDLSEIFMAEIVSALDKPTDYNELHQLEVTKRLFQGILKRIRYNSSVRKKREEVLIFINEPNQWQVIEPIYMALKNKGLYAHVITTKEKLVKQLSSDFLSITYVYGFVHAKHNFNIQSDSIIIQVIKKSLPKIGYLYKYFNKILVNSTYKYVLIGNDITTEGCLLANMAKKYNKKVGTIQHGSINRINPTYMYSVSDHFYVYGNKPANELLFLGKKKDTIVVAGWPLQNEYKQKWQKSLQNNDIRFQSDMLICLSGPGHSVSLDLHKKMISLLENLQKELQLHLLVKLHPKDKKQYYSALDTDKTILMDNEDMKRYDLTLIDLFVRTTCMLTVASNAALESLLTETPVITVDLNNSYQELDFIKDGLTSHVSNYDELKEQFLIIRNSEKKIINTQQKQKLENYYHNYFSESYNPTEIIANKIQELCVV